MKKITVFTPTYNRKNLLERLYNSLVNQTNHDFVWLVIDDGSSDETKKYINYLQSIKNPFIIEYFYKENGGLLTAFNEAVKHIQTDYCMCCDSDDWLPNDCIELIINNLNKIQKNNCAGIIGLDYYKDNTLIGKKIPDYTDYIDLNEIFIKGKLIGDKKLVVKSKLYKNIKPVETINGEKNFNPNYYNVVLSEKYNWYVLNKNLCYVEYQTEGMTNSIFKQYINSPNSFIELRKLYLSLKKATLKFKIKHIIHYDAECILAKRTKNIFFSSPNKILSILFYPFGLSLYFYIMKKGK